MGSVEQRESTSAIHCQHRAARRLMGRAGQAAILIGSAGLLPGCASWDSFIDPSIVGRWEPTPTSVPILDRISVIEDDMGDLVEHSEVLPDDLIPDAKEYRVSPGDRLLITLYDLEDRQGATEFPRDVDLQGNIDLPQLGLIHVGGMTISETQDAIIRAVSRFIIDPLISIVPVAQRQQTFAVVGAVESPGPYFIPRPDYRLLEALTASGRFPESTEEVYVIRQVALDASVNSGVPPVAPTPADSGSENQTTTPTSPTSPTSPTAPPADKKPTENFVDLIDQIAPKQPGEQPKPAPEQPASPDNKPAEPKHSSPSVLTAVIDRSTRQPADSAQPTTPPTPPGPEDPPIDLEGTEGPAATPAGVQPAPAKQEAVIELPQQPAESQTPAIDLSGNDSDPTWVFVNGEWVMVKNQKAAGAPKGAAAAPGTQAAPDFGNLVTQRVIRIPTKPLLAGDARYNIVVRPGDTIRVPMAVAGLVYMTGQVQRPGPYSLPDVGKLTLLRAIDSAGGLSAIAIPERCDITRIVGKDRQATIRLNLRAINEQTEPDLYLKPDDRINIGTTFWALPLAVLRGGFRTNYGFGFVVDRNFGNDIFGPPPEDRSF